ncbi:MAG: signal peptidase I, partial [bacterium]|nr:signal peptidase I [bacterium]
IDQKGEVKRIIAVGGDRIMIKNKVVYLNGEVLNEPYAVYLRKNEMLVGDNIEEMIVPQGHYFVMGDNRDYSEDSRDWVDSNGNRMYFLNRKFIEGKVIIW